MKYALAFLLLLAVGIPLTAISYNSRASVESTSVVQNENGNTNGNNNGNRNGNRNRNRNGNRNSPNSNTGNRS